MRGKYGKLHNRFRFCNRILVSVGVRKTVAKPTMFAGINMGVGREKMCFHSYRLEDKLCSRYYIRQDTDGMG